MDTELSDDIDIGFNFTFYSTAYSAVRVDALGYAHNRTTCPFLRSTFDVRYISEKGVGDAINDFCRHCLVSFIFRITRNEDGFKVTFS